MGWQGEGRQKRRSQEVAPVGPSQEAPSNDHQREERHQRDWKEIVPQNVQGEKERGQIEARRARGEKSPVGKEDKEQRRVSAEYEGLTKKSSSKDIISL